MNKLSATSVAGVLLLVASGPALAQGYYPVDPGYDQGPDFGSPEAPAEDLPPGADYGADPALGGNPASGGGYPEEDYGFASPGGDPAYGGEDQGPRYRRHLQRRLGDSFSQENDRLRRDERHGADEDPGQERRDRNGEFRRHRKQPSNQDFSDQ